MALSALFAASLSGSRPVLVRSTGETISGDALGARVAALGGELASLGLGPGRVVGVVAREPAAFVAGCLAVLARGAVLLPLDARAPAAVTARLLGRAGASALVEGDAPTVTARPPGEARSLPVGLGLLLFTSGSSGPPKGALLASDGLEANVKAILGYLPVASAPRTAVTVPLAYGYGLVGQVLTTLAAAGTVILLSDVPFVADQVKRVAELGADGLASVPPALRGLARAAASLGARPRLAYAASAGGPLDAATVTEVRQAFEVGRFFNQYGLTEASPRVAAVGDDDPAFVGGAVGRALAGLSLRVDGVGEVQVRGPSVMRGYLDDDEATARALPGDGWLRTGDFGRVDDRGYLWIEGRRDGVVKVMGERVSAAEVEEVLRAVPGVSEIAVVALPDPERGARLVAFVEADAADDGAAARVRAAARAELGPARRPASVRVLAALPRTANGKVDQAALRALARSEA